jgi:hypothetical protein
MIIRWQPVRLGDARLQAILRTAAPVMWLRCSGHRTIGSEIQALKERGSCCNEILETFRLTERSNYNTPNSLPEYPNPLQFSLP